MRILLDLDTERPQAAVLELREALGIFSFKVNETEAIGWDNKQRFSAAGGELNRISGLRPEPREPARAAL